MKLLASVSVILSLTSFALATFIPEGGIQQRDTAGEIFQPRELDSRAQRTCKNQGQIGRNKYDPNCLPANSKGYKSSHNCASKGHKSYLCVENDVATCYVSLSRYRL